MWIVYLAEQFDISAAILAIHYYPKLTAGAFLNRVTVLKLTI
jgi:hypothetical protein